MFDMSTFVSKIAYDLTKFVKCNKDIKLLSTALLFFWMID